MLNTTIQITASSIWLIYFSKTNSFISQFRLLLCVFSNILQFIGKFWYLWISLYLNSTVFIFICAKIRKYSQSTLANNRHKFLLLLQFSLRMDYRHLWFVNCFCLRGWSLLPFFFAIFFFMEIKIWIAAQCW